MTIINMTTINCRINLSELKKFLKDECDGHHQGDKINIRLLPLFSSDYDAEFLNVNIQILLDDIDDSRADKNSQTV